MELVHIDQLLSRNNVNPCDLHDWLQQHPLLIDETTHFKHSPSCRQKRPHADNTVKTISPLKEVAEPSYGAVNSSFLYSKAIKNKFSSTNNNNNKNATTSEGINEVKTKKFFSLKTKSSTRSSKNFLTRSFTVPSLFKRKSSSNNFSEK